MKHLELVVQQLNQFDPENEDVGRFLHESTKILQASKVKDEIFLMETLCGCLEYKPVLDVVVDAFYIRDGKYCLFSERNLYIVICYLATFRLEDLGLQKFSKIIKSMDAIKMCKFLRFFFNDVHLRTWIKDEWSQIYDSVYVTDNWIEPLQRWLPKIQKLIDELEHPVEYAVPPLKKTEPKEFYITIPTPRAILIPEQIPALEKPKPIPQSTYKSPRMKQDLERIHLRNRRNAEERLLEANHTPFDCATTQPCKCTHKYEDIPPFHAQKIKIKAENTPIKLNAAAILREGVLYQRKVEEELSRIEHLLQGAQDPSEFLEWQKRMLGKDKYEQQAEAECRRLQGKLSHEEAILARKKLIQENKKKAEQKRQETVIMEQEIAEKILQEKKENEKKIHLVGEGHKNVKQVQMKVQKNKQQIVQEVSKKSQDLLRQALEDEEENFKKRYELIQQIRAIEYVPFLKSKFIDLTMTGNHGVLGEMSIVELQERLALLKEAYKKAEEEKRDLIIQEKHAKEQLLLDKLEQICMFREQFGRAAALRQEEKKTKSPFHESILKDERVLDLQKKIIEKSTDRKTLKSPSPKMSQSKSKEVANWKSLEENKQQHFKMDQHGLMARELDQKVTRDHSLRIGTNACILRS